MAKGKYTPKYPEKYMGDVNKITFRSSWELRFMEFCDNNVNIVKWASEEIVVPYIKPTDGKVHRYYPDFYIEYWTGDNQYKRELIEIKPYKESGIAAAKAKHKNGRRKKTSTYDQIMAVINESKWKAANELCKKHGIHFRVLTERSLFKT